MQFSCWTVGEGCNFIYSTHSLMYSWKSVELLGGSIVAKIWTIVLSSMKSCWLASGSFIYVYIYIYLFFLLFTVFLISPHTPPLAPYHQKLLSPFLSSTLPSSRSSFFSSLQPTCENIYLSSPSLRYSPWRQTKLFHYLPLLSLCPLSFPCLSYSLYHLGAYLHKNDTPASDTHSPVICQHCQLGWKETSLPTHRPLMLLYVKSNHGGAGSASAFSITSNIKESQPVSKKILSYNGEKKWNRDSSLTWNFP